MANASNIFSNVNNGIGAAQNLLNIFGGFQQMQQQRRLYNDRIDVGNYARESQQFLRDRLLEVYPQLREQLGQQADFGQLLGIGTAEAPGALIQALQQLQTNPSTIQSLFQGLGVDPQQGSYIDPLRGWSGQNQTNSENLAGRFAPAMGQNDELGNFFSQLLNGGFSTSQNNAGEELLQNGGRTELGNQATSALQQIIGTGGKSADLTSLMQVLMGGVATGGKTDTLTATQQAALKMLGVDPNSQNAISAAQRMINSGGVTQNSAQGSQAALDLLKDGGMTNELSNASSIGLNKASREALLSDDSAQSFLAGVLGSKAVKNTAEGMRLAQMRGGGSGALVDSGDQENIRKNASSQNMEIAADAMLKQQLEQQKLRLEENQVGGNLFANAQGAAQNRAGTGAGLLGSMENANTQRFAAGSSLLDSMLGRDTQRAATGFQGINTGQGLENDRLSMFINQALGGNQQGTNSLMQAISGLQGQNAQNISNLGAGSQLQNSYYNNLFQSANGLGSTADRNNQMGQQGLGWGQLAQSGLGQALGGYNQSLGQNSQFINDFLNQNRGNTQDLIGLGSGFMNYGAQGTQGSLNLFNQLLSGYGGAMGTFAGLFGNSGNTAQNPFGQYSYQRP
jgi:hypothetical protein